MLVVNAAPTATLVSPHNQTVHAPHVIAIQQEVRLMNVTKKLDNVTVDQDPPAVIVPSVPLSAMFSSTTSAHPAATTALAFF